MFKAVVFDMYETLITIFDAPPYYSAAMAKDAGVPVEAFRQVWRMHEHARTIGACSLSQAVNETLKALNEWSEELACRMVEKRLRDQQRIYSTIHPEILDMLRELKRMGLKIGLVTNCYDEERACILQSPLAAFFDVAMFSCEQGICKPEPLIFERCLRAMHVTPQETVYVGDGGSMELEQAAALGMTALQACWFIDDEAPERPTRRKEGWRHLETPCELTALLS